MLTGWLWLDPAISLGIAVIILFGTWRLLKDSIDLSIDAVPQGIDVTLIKSYLSGMENVSDIHDLHVWALSTTETALTVHLVTNCEFIDNCFLHRQLFFARDTRTSSSPLQHLTYYHSD
jgi:cobalt-zinc-cadmium efflux system protein